jgi:GcrA cell cycle regulator
LWACASWQVYRSCRKLERNKNICRVHFGGISLEPQACFPNYLRRIAHNTGKGMAKHPTKYSWTPQEIEKLEKLVASGASAARAAGALNRKIMAVQLQARRLGTPFPTVRATRRKLEATVLAAAAHKPA